MAHCWLRDIAGPRSGVGPSTCSTLAGDNTTRLGPSDPMNAPDKSARERRLRNYLMMRGYRLVRSRHRLSPPKGGYLIVEFAVNQIVAGGEPSPFSLTLDDVEAWARQLQKP
jgi:hypothetical protein